MGKELTVHINCNSVEWEHLNTPTVISCVCAENHISSNSLNCKAVLFLIPQLSYNQDSTMAASKAQEILFLVPFTSKGSHFHVVLPLTTR